jgi:hypothetical protein
MMRSLGFGVLTAIAMLGCAAKNNDSNNGVNGVMGTGGAPVTGTMTIGTGGAPAGATTTGTGGTGVQTGSTGGAPANPMAPDVDGNSTGMMAGTGGKGTAGMGAGMGGMGEGTGGMEMTGTGGMDNTTPPPADFHPPCLTKGDDLVLLGDSYVNYIESLEPRLTSHAQMDGVLKAGDRFSDHAVPGTSLAAMAPLIPPEWYDDAKSLKPTFIVMDGGGNDVLLWHSECLNDGASQDTGCQQVVKDATDVARMMMDDMIATSVKQILYFFYPNVPAGGADITNYAYPMAKEQCEARSDATFECTMVDMRPVFMGHNDWFMVDGIHPLAPGMDAMGDTIWGVMKDHCMAQTEAQNCGCVSK